MYKSIYIALAGARMREEALNTAAHNLSNVNTVGYKREHFSIREYRLTEAKPILFPAYYDNARSMSLIESYGVDTTAGSIVETGNPLDIAVNGNGFFSVRTSEGVQYTKNGSFSLNSEGQLITSDGNPVLGEEGDTITLSGGGAITVASSGEISVNGSVVGKLKITSLQNIKKAGNGLYSGEEKPFSGTIKQGYLELSNVNPIKEMVSLIEAMRYYESSQKVIQSLDGLTEKIVNEFGRI